jgi:hypothetical protein
MAFASVLLFASPNLPMIGRVAYFFHHNRSSLSPQLACFQLEGIERYE